MPVGHWTVVATRSSGTVVHRVDGRRHAWYVKTTPVRETTGLGFDPPGEAARLGWLGRRGFPVPEVVDVGATPELAWLVTRAVGGRPAAGPWAPAELPAVLDVVADLTRALHALPVADCPFDRTLAVSLPEARLAAGTGRVDLDDLEDRHRGWTARRLLDELEATPAPMEHELVVCHGDLCLDNVLITPGAPALAGILDVGRLGRADRWLDLSIVLRNLDECGDWAVLPDRTGRFLRRYGLAAMDGSRCHYYRLLDEFF